MKPKFEPDDFEIWMSNPVTEAFLARLKEQVGACRDQWMSQSWDGQQVDPVQLAYLKARADTYEDMSKVNFEWFTEDESE
jgi:hypothetical protein